MRIFHHGLLRRMKPPRNDETVVENNRFASRSDT
jgi:hypothetical protein